MKRIFIVLSFLLITIISYSEVKWDGEDGRVTIIYKIVDPLIVEVEQPQKLVIGANQKKFTYSEASKRKKALLVTVKSPYNQVDELLRKIYETVYFKLDNNGEFKLTNEKTTKEISGKGYFIDNEAQATRDKKVTEISKPFANRVNGNGFSVTTGVDADFTLPEEEVPMGVYKGTLYLNVWFGGTLK